MSNDNTSIIEIPESVDNAIKNATDKPTQSIGEILNDLLFLIFGDIHNKSEMRRMRYTAGLEKFKKELNDNINQIPTERLLEPNTRLVLSSLDASKYTVEEENLRKMFARLISKSMDSEYSNYVHPSFVTIIKDMSPLDAENLALFKENESLPIVNYKINFNNNQFVHIRKNVFVSNPNNTNLAIQSTSITMLSRFGLIMVNYNEQLTDDSFYDGFGETDEYKKIDQDIESCKKMSIEEINSLPDELKGNAQSLQKSSLIIEKGYVELTDLGKDFVKICLWNNLYISKK